MRSECDVGGWWDGYGGLGKKEGWNPIKELQEWENSIRARMGTPGTVGSAPEI